MQITPWHPGKFICKIKTSTGRFPGILKAEAMKASYKIYKEMSGKIQAIRTSTRKREIEALFNGIIRNHKRHGIEVIKVRQGYCVLPYFSVEYWIAKD